MTDTLIDLIRHGEPVGGRAYRGHSIDDPLSEKGWQEMWDSVGDEPPWQQVITSPMERCQAFAEALMDMYGIPCTSENDFREIGFGSWEGRTPDEIIASNREEYEAFYQDPVNNRPPGAESLQGFIERVTSAYNRVINEHKGKHILVIAHAGVNRAIIAHALHAEPAGMYRINVKTAGISRIRHNQLGNTLMYHNVQLADMA